MRQPQGLGLRLQACRVSLGLTLSELGQHAHLDRMTLWRVEQGVVQDLKGKAVARLARALGVSMDYLYGLTDTPHPYPRRFDAAPAPASPASPGPPTSHVPPIDLSTLCEGEAMSRPSAAAAPQTSLVPVPARELAAEVLRLQIAALDIPAIAQALQLDPATVQTHLDAALAAYPMSLEQHRALELARLQALLAVWWPHALAPTRVVVRDDGAGNAHEEEALATKALTVVLGLLDRRYKLLGLTTTKAKEQAQDISALLKSVLLEVRPAPTRALEAAGTPRPPGHLSEGPAARPQRADTPRQEPTPW